jgi:hypothetical protein
MYFPLFFLSNLSICITRSVPKALFPVFCVFCGGPRRVGWAGFSARTLEGGWSHLATVFFYACVGMVMVMV